MNDRDLELFELLDKYVSMLGEQDSSSRTCMAPEALLKAHPDLAGLLQCLDTLDSLAIAPVHDRAGATADDALDAVSDDSAAGEVRGRGTGRPDEFGRYQLLGEIGRGGMGVIYRARQTMLGSDVALKMIRSNHLASADEIRRFYQEARAAAGLRHPNIVSVHDVGDVDGQHFLTMDFVDGGSLADLLRTGPLDPELAAELLLTVAQAVQYLHDHQVIHRDLKPSNILLDAGGQPSVTDFGLAKVFHGDSQETASGTILGTPSYMSPEQAAGRAALVSPRSDVYSLGAILYEMLTGRAPFNSENPLDTVLQVLESEPIAPRRLQGDVPSDLEEICLRCLEKQPSARFPSAADLANELGRFLRGEPVVARSSTLWTRWRRWCRREPALVTRLTVLCAAAVVVQANYHLNGESFRRHLLVMGVLSLWLLSSVLCQCLLRRRERILPGNMGDSQQLSPTRPWDSSARNRPPGGRHRDYASVTSLLLQTPWQLARTIQGDPALGIRAGWAAADALCFTATLLISPYPIGPLLIGYPVLVVASGLWFEVGLVWFMTLICTLSYAWLTYQRFETGMPVHYPVIFAVALLGTGFIVAYQVFRIRALSRYFDRRANA